MKKLLVIAMTAVLLISLFAVNLSAAELSIPRALTAPVIDGKINADEWANALAIDMKQDNLNWVLDVNPSSGNSMYYFMWDAGYIYFAADVKDTTVSDIIPSYGAALNSGDGTQWAFYGMDSTGGTTEGEQMMFFSIHPKADNGQPDVYEHFNQIAQLADVKIASVFSGTAYILECAVPFSVFAAAYANGFINDIKGVAGQQWKMDLVIMDADGSDQSLGTNAAWFDPAASNTYTLVDAGAGIDPAPPAAETQAEAAAEAEAEAEAAAPVTTAAQTSDYALASLILMAFAAAVMRKKR
ncbi:MAG: sugar-binding protein [Eubacteriales bacterium]|nr:sugar-binding protein [Eubacteriales bacterium]